MPEMGDNGLVRQHNFLISVYHVMDVGSFQAVELAWVVGGFHFLNLPDNFVAQSLIQRVVDTESLLAMF